MPLHDQHSILYLSFNQDYTCICIADFKGLKIYSLETQKLCYAADLGAISIAEMLFCTSLMAYVGAGEQPELTPRKLTLLNTTTQNIIQNLSFPSSVLAVRMNRKRLVAVLERKTYVHALENLQLLCTLETAPNPKGCCTLSPTSEPGLLALPSSASSGTLRVYDVMVDGGNVLCELTAHKSPVAVMAWDQEGTMLASASQKGTLIRVHRLPQAAKVYSFRRGTSSAPINSMAFTPPGVQPALLCASSGHGTVHLFRLVEAERSPAVAAASGMLAAVLPHSVADVVDPQRCIATIRLPGQSIPAIAAFRPAPQPGQGSADPEAGRPARAQASRQEDDAVTVVVATTKGIVYEYCISHMLGPQPPHVSLEQEAYLAKG